ncbi:TetR/AcrR family transcriptional regulator [Aldersonia sp. NBC_00410]|uniref:TetR/AcrR family transcriptional regulator n=1 Tax=Aldersonia sp. NBC_00410 TaxID=2975954 RepID=UPI002251C18A|nr:TetR/AcrR family transcriptional regulator [Aldersonia sp. NBC_00410]MCX5043135.1 TetR/AcrR family transcriptional regulator [Aldersonia sp. NBC_00410]
MRSRRKVLDATLELIAAGGFAEVNIAAVAHAAGVSRQTVYSIFGSREELVSQAMAGLAADHLETIRGRLEHAETPTEYVVELIVASRSVSRSDPVLSTLLHAEQGNPLFDTGMLARAKAVNREMLTPLLERYPSIEPRLDDIADMAVRLGVTVLLFDDDATADDDDLRAFLTRWLGPAMPNCS